MAACFSELVEGLQFSAHKGKAGLHHVALGKKGCQQHDLLSLTAPGLDLLKAQEHERMHAQPVMSEAG